MNQARRNRKQPVPISLDVYTKTGLGDSNGEALDRYEPPDAHGEDAADQILEEGGEEKG